MASATVLVILLTMLLTGVAIHSWASVIKGVAWCADQVGLSAPVEWRTRVGGS
jgi:hypothetical protein